MWLRGYDYMFINKRINEDLKLSKEIYFYMWPLTKDGKMCKDLIMFIKEDNEKIYINPRKNVRVKTKYLSDEDKNKLNNYLNSYGMDLLNYQLRKIGFRDLVYLGGSV